MAVSLIITDTQAPITDPIPVTVPVWGEVDISVARAYAVAMYSQSVSFTYDFSTDPNPSIAVAMRQTGAGTTWVPGNMALTMMPSTAGNFGFILDSTFNPLYRRVAAASFLQGAAPPALGVFALAAIPDTPVFLAMPATSGAWGRLVLRARYSPAAANTTDNYIATFSITQSEIAPGPVSVASVQSARAVPGQSIVHAESAPFLMQPGGTYTLANAFGAANGGLTADDLFGDGGYCEIQLYVYGGYFPSEVAATRPDFIDLP